MADPTYVRRIIANLSTNAIKAMPSGGKLTINAKRKNGKTELKRSDTGEGIPEALRDQAFKPLFTTKSKGQGFGLAVVKKFVEKLGGTVSFSSEANVGTTFIVQLP